MHVQPPVPEPPLNKWDTFLQLSVGKRAALVVLLVAGHLAGITPTYIWNVLPHVVGMFNDKYDLANFICFSIVVVTLSMMLIAFALAENWFRKVLIVVLTIGLGVLSLDNTCRVQRAGYEAKVKAQLERNALIGKRTDELKATNTAWSIAKNRRSNPEVGVTEEDVNVAREAVRTAEKAMSAECNRASAVKGRVAVVPVTVRGQDCGRFINDLAARQRELKQAQADKSATDDMRRLEFTADGQRKELEALGLPVPDVGKPKVTGIALWLNNRGVMSDERAMSFASDMPETAGITYELLAWIGPPVWFAVVFYIFGLMTCTKTEADRRVHEMSLRVAADYAAKSAETLLPDGAPEHAPIEPPASRPFGWMDDKPEPEPVNHAEVLGINEPDPAFVEAPRNVEEAASAEYYKAAKAKRQRQPRTPKGEPAPLNESTVVQWFNERCFEAVGRITLSTEAHPDYVQWCKQHNYNAYKVRKFGDILEKECFVKKQRTNGATKYYDIGIRPAHLRVVSG